MQGARGRRQGQGQGQDMKTHQTVARLYLLQLESLDAGFCCPTVSCSYSSIGFQEIQEIQEIQEAVLTYDDLPLITEPGRQYRNRSHLPTGILLCSY